MNNEACVLAGADRSEATESLSPILSAREYLEQGTISRLQRAGTYFRRVVQNDLPADVVMRAVDALETPYGFATNGRLGGV